MDVMFANAQICDAHFDNFIYNDSWWLFHLSGFLFFDLDYLILLLSWLSSTMDNLWK
jgi:hypothetical protein